MGRAFALLASLSVAAVLLGGCARDPGPDITADLVEMPSPAGPGSSAPHLALTPAGAVVMSWLEASADGAVHELRFSTLGPDGWSSPGVVARGTDFFVNWADYPSVSPITANDWAAHWLVKQPGGIYSYDVAIAISRDAGANWSAPLTPHDDGTPTEHGFATLFRWDDALGAIWLDGRNTKKDAAGESMAPDPGGMTVRYARIGFDGKMLAGGEIDDLVCDCCATDVAVVAAGPVVTYRNRTREEIRDIAVARYADGAWQPPVILGDDQWYLPGCPVNGSTIAARGERVVVAWFSASKRQPRVQLAWSADGGASFSAPVLVDQGTVSGRVDVVLLADDVAVVSWTAKLADGSGEIRMRRVPASGEPGPVRTVTKGDVSRNAGFPQMVATAERLVFAWTVPGEPSRVTTATLAID